MEKANGRALAVADIQKRTGLFEGAEAEGHYTLTCRDKNGNVKWEEGFDNLVTTAGKNFALDTFLAGSAYTVTGPYLGLINANANAAAATDTMASHPGWLEVGLANAPVYTGTRQTVSFGSATGGGKQSNALMTFNVETSGTIGGCFLVFGPGASNAIGSTGGILYSAGAFSAGSKMVAQFDTLTVTYTASL